MTQPRLADPLLAPSDRMASLVTEDGFHVATICDVLGLAPARLGELTGRSTPSAAGLVAGNFKRVRDPRTARVLNELVEVIGLLDALGGVEHARSWLMTPLPSYQGSSPYQIIKDNRGRELIDDLLALAAGNVS